MSYTQNPYVPKVRALAVGLVRKEGWTGRKTARYIGVSPGTVSKWLKKAPLNVGEIYEIPTVSSRPKHSPRTISKEIVKRIVEIRGQRGRCAEVIHAQLQREGITVSLSTVKRTLDREGLTKKRSKWKKYHLSGERPKAQKPGDLVQIDTIHVWDARTQRTYIYTMLDCYSRWAYARAANKINTSEALRCVSIAKERAPFTFSCVQSDNGQEFSKHFTTR